MPYIVWPRLLLGARGLKVGFWTVLYGAYVNWAGNLLAAFFGTSQLTPLAGEGYEAAAWQEMIVNIALGTSSLAILVGVAVVLFGTRGNEPSPSV